MNIKLLAIAVLAILLLGAGGLFLYNNQSAKPKTSTNDSTTKTENNNKSMSLMDLISSGQSQRCTFTTTTKEGTSKGTVYVSGSNVRSDIATNANNKESQVSMIRNGDDNYIWGSDMEAGIKIKISLEELSTNTQAQQYASSLNANDKVDYNCTPWTVDSSLFTPPSTIKFTDMSALLDSSKAKTTGTPSYSCASIENAAARAACENAMKK